MLRFRCSVCQKNLLCDDEQAQDRVKCAGCGAILIAPDISAAAAATITEAVEAPLHVKVQSDGESEDMDMTPMVDVTFLLLIFFMVTASYALQKTFEFPQSDSQETARQVSLRDVENDPDFVVVRVDQYNTFFVSGANLAGDEEHEVTDRQSLLVELRRARDPGVSGHVPSRLVVIAHGEARHEKVVLAMDAGNEVGIQDVMLMTTEEDEV